SGVGRCCPPLGGVTKRERTRMAASLEQDADLRISDVRRTTRTNPLSALDGTDLICLSHLRWNFVYQRPQHLLSRAGTERRIFFVEEPVVGGDDARMDLRDEGNGVTVCEPHLPD